MIFFSFGMLLLLYIVELKPPFPGKLNSNRHSPIRQTQAHIQTYTSAQLGLLCASNMYGNIFTSTPTIPSHMTASKLLILYNQISFAVVILFVVVVGAALFFLILCCNSLAFYYIQKRNYINHFLIASK